jgi:hypothetical protein
MAVPTLLLGLAHLTLSLRRRFEWATLGLPFGLALLVILATH